ncbi:MAG TPA: signal peptidase II [Puia sp.]|jgi:signal peptidase II|nr:signal peptidase II [Puia sp.]
MKKWYKIILFCVLAFTFIGCDRVTKTLAKEQLMNRGVTISYFHDVFRLEYIENTGAALGFGENLSEAASFWLLSIFPLTCLLALFVYTVRRSNEMSLSKVCCLALIFAGGVGNIIDRIFFDRHVTDFMNIGILDLRTAIFNFADVYITIGVIAFILLYRTRTPVSVPQ